MQGGPKQVRRTCSIPFCIVTTFQNVSFARKFVRNILPLFRFHKQIASTLRSKRTSQPEAVALLRRLDKLICTGMGCKVNAAACKPWTFVLWLTLFTFLAAVTRVVPAPAESN